MKSAALVSVRNVVILREIYGSNVDGRLGPDLWGSHCVVPPTRSIQGEGAISQ